MVDNANNSEKLKQIVESLPKKNCGKCGFENCGHFALAAAKGEASSFGCRRDASAGFTICRILGLPVPDSVTVQSDISQTGPRHGFGKHHHHHHTPFLFGHFLRQHHTENPPRVD